MTGIARACPLFTKMVDTLAPVSHEQASALKAVGVGAVGRYLEDLTLYEIDGLFAAGLGILLLSEAPAGPLDANLGLARANRLIQKALLLGAPTTMHLMIDFEAQQGSHTDVTAYDTTLSHAIAHAGFVPLAYVGVPQPLSGAELYALPDVHLYWRGGSLGVPEPGCGFAIWQIPPLDQGSVIPALRADMSMTGADLRGRHPIMWWAD